VLVEGRMTPSSHTLAFPEWRKTWVPSLTHRHPGCRHDHRPPATSPLPLQAAARKKLRCRPRQD
jgi:hypothetical protein